MMDFVNAYGNQITSPYIETDTGKTCTEAQFSIGKVWTSATYSSKYVYYMGLGKGSVATKNPGRRYDAYSVCCVTDL